jgi:uncharacterized protein (TIGR02145 family)
MLNGIRTVLLRIGEWGRMLSLFATAAALALGLCGCTDVPEYPDNCKGEYFFGVPCVDYTLTVSRNPISGGTATAGSSTTNISAGTQVDISATANSGYSFSNWTITGNGTLGNANSASTYVTVNGDVTVTANWTQYVTPPDNIVYGELNYGGQKYNTVKIGSQTWMAENLNYETSSGSWCYDCATYGRLYDWSTAKNVCPSGWHLPSRSEWQTLVRAVDANAQFGKWWDDDNVAGKKLKAKDGWNSGGNGSDDYGFSALPGGGSGNGDYFINVGTTGNWWTATEYDIVNAYSRVMYYESEGVLEGYSNKNSGFSVRCLQDSATYTYTLTVSKNPTSGGTTTPASSQSNISAGTQVNISATAASGYTFNNWTISGSGTIANSSNASTSVTVNGNVTVTANFQQSVVVTPGVGEFADSRDNKTYKKVTIGTQTWMAENLNYQPASGSGNSWCYDNEDSYCSQYGRLYDWSTAKTVCPSGWHLPSRAEWQTLVRAVDANAQLTSSGWDDNNVAGRKLKSTSGWYSNGNGIDSVGFSALPGGFRDSDGNFYSAGGNGSWWTATEDGASHAYGRDVYYNYDNVYENNYYKSNGFSVRCVSN